MRILKTIRYIVPESSAGFRLDKALSLHEEIESRSLASKIIAWNCVTLEGKPVKASQSVLAGQVFDVQLPAKEFEELTPFELGLDVLHEDEDLIVINKPSGLVVHPAAGHFSDTLVNALIFHNKNLSAGSEAFRPGLVHRLDKDTSGLLVVAKNDRSHRILADQFRLKTAHRRYQALCFGVPRLDSGRIETYLARHPNDRKRWASLKSKEEDPQQGKRATTNYKTLQTHPAGLSLVELVLETGRTHQIRVHLSELGHGIVGDPIYAQKNRAKNLKGQKWQVLIQKVARLMLHAAELGFKHPDGRDLVFSKDWPDDSLETLKALGFK